jgi:hypothetical protein
MAIHRFKPTELDRALEQDPRARAAHRALFKAALIPDEANDDTLTSADSTSDPSALSAIRDVALPSQLRR